MKPTTVLKNEHRVIERVLGVLERLTRRAREGGPFEAESMASCIEFFRLFADACHHAKEEGMLFPVLVDRGLPENEGPIAVMLEEHRIARGLVAEMDAGLEERADSAADGEERVLRAAESYLDLLRHHIAKEDNVLFAIGDQVMTDEDRRSLGERFCTAICPHGSAQHEELEQLAEDLEQRWPPS